jgi:hypothetical protein
MGRSQLKELADTSAGATKELPYVASMGLYVFKADVLRKLLMNPELVDFGKHVIPYMMQQKMNVKVGSYVCDVSMAIVCPYVCSVCVSLATVCSYVGSVCRRLYCAHTCAVFVVGHSVRGETLCICGGDLVPKIRCGISVILHTITNFYEHMIQAKESCNLFSFVYSVI